MLDLMRLRTLRNFLVATSELYNRIFIPHYYMRFVFFRPSSERQWEPMHLVIPPYIPRRDRHVGNPLHVLNNASDVEQFAKNSLAEQRYDAASWNTVKST